MVSLCFPQTLLTPKCPSKFLNKWSLPSSVCNKYLGCPYCTHTRGYSLRIGRCADRLQVLHDAPVAGSPQARSIPEGLGLRRARLVIEDLNGIHIFILAPDVLVHHQRRQARPHNSSDEGAQLDHIAEGLRILLRDCDELVAQDSQLTDAARHVCRSYCNWNLSSTRDPIFTPRVLEPSKEIILNERVAVTQSHLLKCQGCLRFIILAPHNTWQKQHLLMRHYITNHVSVIQASSHSAQLYWFYSESLYPSCPRPSTCMPTQLAATCLLQQSLRLSLSKSLIIYTCWYLHINLFEMDPFALVAMGSLLFTSSLGPKNSFCGLGWLVSAAPTLSWNQPKSKMSLFARGWGCLLRIGRCADRLQVLHDAPVAGSPQARSIPEGLGLRRAGLVIEDLNGIHIFILAADVLVHHQRRQARPHNSSDEGAQLDHIAEGLRILLRDCDELVAQDSQLTDAARHDRK